MKKFILVLALFVLTFSSFGVVASAASFTDLKKGQRFYDEMLYLENKGIITGFPDGKFRPDRVVSRADAAIMIGRALDLDGAQRDTKFRDVGADQKASGYIASAVEAGIIQGFSDDIYRPDDTVTRGQMAIFLSRAFRLTEEADVHFRDVSHSTNSHVYIKRIVAENITSGYEDYTYRPEINVTRAQFSAFLARALDDQFKVDLPPVPSSFLKDKNKIYHYKSDNRIYTYKFPNRNYDNWNLWDIYIGNVYSSSILEYEDSQWLYLGYPESEYYFELKYPVVVGQSWTNGYEDEYKHKITSTTKTVTTPAGTFYNVVEVKGNTGLVSYYAHNVGHIKSVLNGVTRTELIKIENR